MNRKLQVFVSSTYTDLIAERQAAVDAILRAGHIPAGMELFAAGDKSQLEVIRRWIDESDVYMLILGGRYGSIDPETGKSYTELEYEYAVERGKRFFAVVLTPKALDIKVKARGLEVAEQDNKQNLDAFRAVVKSKVCRMVEDEKDIKIAVHETLLDFLRMYSFDGWVSGKDVVDTSPLKEEVVRLSQENADLRAHIDGLRSQGLDKHGEEQEFQEIASHFAAEVATFTQDEEVDSGIFVAIERIEHSVLDWILRRQHSFILGVDGTEHPPNFLHDNIGARLLLYRLADRTGNPNGPWGHHSRISLNEKGLSFLRYIQKQPSPSSRSTP